MLKISLEKNETKIAEILSKHNLSSDNIVMSAYDDGKFVGYATGLSEGHSLKVTEFCVLSCLDYTNLNDEEKFVAELLIRSLANYAANRDMILLTGDNNNLFFTSVLFGMNSSKDSVRIFVPSLLSGCKGEKNKS